MDVKFNSSRLVGTLTRFALIIICLVAFPCLCRGQAASHAIKVLGIEGVLEILHQGATNWVPAAVGDQLSIGDQLRTSKHSRATIRLSNDSVLRVGELMNYKLEPPRQDGQKPELNIRSGAAYFFSRDRQQEVQIRTPTVVGAIRGTEFNITVQSDGQTVVTMIDGLVELTNSLGNVMLATGDSGEVAPGKPPVRTAVINAINIIQWNLYYPGILDLADLALSPAERSRLEPSLAAYQAGDLLAALKKYTLPLGIASSSEEIYYANLLLAVGQVEEARQHLVNAADSSNRALAGALEEVIAAVKFETFHGPIQTNSASGCLAGSYYEQSRGNLTAALADARLAVAISPRFGFAWERVAELEFSFGRREAALEALNRSFDCAPLNPQAMALRGFLLAAGNDLPAAKAAFQKAIEQDASLGNGWLGRGLCRIRSGDVAGGRDDLLLAAALEPNRSVLRSYLGKAFDASHEDQRADHEYSLARRFDPRDPTPWLYSALLKQQQNRINEAIQDLNESQAKNDNRSLFRSRLLLDQDQAMRGANLAAIYRDNNMTEVSLREASQAVVNDYANPSAHLFLSDAYNDLRDPTQFNLRYETVWFNELLLANLLSPVGGGRLSQTVSQQDYSKLFQQDGLGLASASELRSDGIYHEQASQFGTFGNTAYSVDLNYHHNNGIRPNNTLDDVELNTSIKQQVSPKDTALLLVQNQNYHSGDNFQYYDSTQARPYYKFSEYQQPNLVGGWNHEWTPGLKTLALVDRLTDRQEFSDHGAPQFILEKDASDNVLGAFSQPYDVSYQNKFTIYGTELNQIVQWDRFTLSAGGRYQSGTFQAQDQMSITNPLLSGLFPPATNAISADFERITGYGYLTVEPVDHVWITGGVTYDQATYPDNYRQPPVSSGTDSRSQLGPKAALVWSPIPEVTLRGVYARSLGGVSLDESYRLEPTQLAGFPQAFRSLISESIVGSVAAPEYKTMGVALDLKLGAKTFLGLQAERLTTSVQRNLGDFVVQYGVVPGTTPESLNYSEYDLSASLNQLVGKCVVLGTSYRITRSRLNDVLSEIPVAVLATANQTEQSTLQQAKAYVLFNHPSGFFARAELCWYGQVNSGWSTEQPGDRFFQENVYAGYYFAHRRAKVQLGILNLAGGDYQLNPLTPYQELPRSRVFDASLTFSF